MGHIMRLEIVRMADPADPKNKSARPALLYGQPEFIQGELWQIAIPMTSNACVTHKGCVLLTNKSPAYASTGFDARESCIQIKEMFRFRATAESSELVKRTGHFLNLAKDKYLHAQFGQVMREVATNNPRELCQLPIAF